MGQKKRTIRWILSMLIISVLVLAAAPLAADDMMDLPMQDQLDQRDEVAEEQLQQFGFALISIQEIQIEANEAIDEVLASSELSEERITEIMQLQQAAPEEAEDQVAEDELAEFEQTITEVEQVHESAEAEMVDAVEDVGFDVEEFNQLAQQIDQNPDLMNRLQEMFMN